ncbi:HNH endonuclease family protein [Micromonospora sp. LAH09]|uniref:HNH endonuclease family protein n=1 Tax=Micromonospora cabrerizensis TaxID=2911213 RepID=UPI001EE84F1D|nr:HNH endonuclease family protein [Micromonospora cabrerizensis]MCG5470801.1 HNH endonuclease family protein [Micromonospora cabrerizensis]
MRTTSGPRAAVIALAAALALGVAGCVPQDEPDTPPSSDGGNAVQQLGQLTVATAGSMKGYSRDHFPHWRDTGKNCDVRDSILQRDGKDVKLSGCNVVDGRWESVYDGRSAADPADVDIDHMVPLANAWRSGADEWDDQKRGDFANDTTRPQLIAVSASSNRAKGDQDPSQWKPANREYWCKYAESWVTVKHYWRLTVTSAEKAALTDMLEGCTVGNES